MWIEQWGEISPYNLVGVEQYLEEMHHVLNDCSLKKKCHNFLPFLFKVNYDGSSFFSSFNYIFYCTKVAFFLLLFRLWIRTEVEKYQSRNSNFSSSVSASTTT